jgi:hypothetical protein
MSGLGLLSMVSRGSESAWNKETFNKYGTPVEDLGSFALDVLVSKTSFNLFDDKVGSHVFPVQREGCLVRGTHLIIDLPCIPTENDPDRELRWVSDIGHAVIESVTLEVDGRVVDVHLGDYMHVLASLSGCEPIGSTNAHRTQTVCVPLQFSYCKDIRNALPIHSMQVPKINIRVQTHALHDLLRYKTEIGLLPNTSPTFVNHVGGVKMCTEFIMLDSDIRKSLMTKRIHTHRIQRVHTDTMEFMSNDSDICNVPLTSTLPCSSIMFICQRIEAARFDYSSLCGNNPVISAALTVNGDDITGRHILGQYYNEIVPRDIWKTKSAVAMGVNAYSFTLYPTTDTYATNVWDFGELKNTSLQLRMTRGTWKISVYSNVFDCTTVSLNQFSLHSKSDM